MIFSCPYDIVIIDYQMTWLTRGIVSDSVIKWILLMFQGKEEWGCCDRLWLGIKELLSRPLWDQNRELVVFIYCISIRPCGTGILRLGFWGFKIIIMFSTLLL